MKSFVLYSDSSFFRDLDNPSKVSVCFDAVERILGKKVYDLRVVRFTVQPDRGYQSRGFTKVRISSLWCTIKRKRFPIHRRLEEFLKVHIKDLDLSNNLDGCFYVKVEPINNS